VKVLVLGMGNPILSDDGVGLVVANALKGRIKGVDVAVSAMIGFELIDIVCGYDQVFVVDAMCTRGGVSGDIRKISALGGEGTLHLFSSHGMNFFELIEMGRSCGLCMPEVGAVYGIEIGDCVTFTEEISDNLRDSIGTITEDIRKDITLSIPAY
jgi:hydrogenase maturation protease